MGKEVMDKEWLIGEGKTLRVNPYGLNEKFLKFLRNLDGTLSLVAKLLGDIHPVTCGYNFEDKFWVFPHQGPRLLEGELVPHNDNYRIKKIHYDTINKYYVMELEEI